MLVLLVLAGTPSIGQADEPLTFRGELKKSDPRDRLRKHSPHKVHEVDLKKGQAYRIELHSARFDTFLRVEDGTGKVMAENDDIGPTDLNSRLGFVPQRSGKYRLIVTSSQGGQAGAYEVHIEPLQAAGPPLEIKGTFTARSSMVQGRPSMVYKGALPPDRWYLIEVSSSDFEPQLVLRDPSNKILTRDANDSNSRSAQFLWRSERGGDFLVQVLAARPGAMGNYLVRMRPFRGSGGGAERDRQLAQAKELYEAGLRLSEQGKLVKAARKVRQAVDRYELLYPESRFPDGHADLANSLNELGALLADLGEHGKALGYYERALAMRERLFPAARFPAGHAHLARSLNNLGVLLTQMGQHRKALACYERSLGMCERLYPKARYPEGHADLVSALSNLGDVLQKLGEPSRALSYFEQALAMCECLFPRARFPNGHPYLASSLNNVGALLRAMGEPSKALGYYERALAMRERLFPKARVPDGHANLAQSLNNLGVLLAQLGEQGKALGYFERALAMRERLFPKALFPDGQPAVAVSLSRLGDLLAQLGQQDRALTYLERALAMSERLYPRARFPDGHADLISSLHNLGFLLTEMGQPSKALGYQARALAMCERLFSKARFPHGHVKLAISLHSVGALLQLSGEERKALGYHERALAMYRRLGDDFAATVSESQAVAFLASLPQNRDALLSAAVAVPGSEAASYASIWRTKAALTRLLQRRHQAIRVALANSAPTR
jgi:tetratricopeptide (TPR) repeat protein